METCGKLSTGDGGEDWVSIITKIILSSRKTTDEAKTGAEDRTNVVTIYELVKWLAFYVAPR